MANEDIKQYAKNNGVFLWELSEHFGYKYSEQFSRKLRHEFSENDKRRAFDGIEIIRNRKMERSI